jgi:hypothetical protein
MRDVTRTQDWFLRDPRCRRWIVQCAACRLFGRKPEAPAGMPKYRFEEMFPVMDLDERGICQHCRPPRPA